MLQDKLPKELQELTISLAKDERGGLKELQDATERLVKRVDQRAEELASKIEECMHRYTDKVDQLKELDNLELELALEQFGSSQSTELTKALGMIYSDKYDAGWWLLPLVKKCIATEDTTVDELITMCTHISSEREVLSNHLFSEITSVELTAEDISIGVAERASSWTVRGLVVHAVGMVPGLGGAAARRDAVSKLLDTVLLDGRTIAADDSTKWQLVQRRLALDDGLKTLEKRWRELAENPITPWPANTKPVRDDRDIAQWVDQWLRPLFECAACVAKVMRTTPSTMTKDRHAAFSMGRAQREKERAQALQELVLAQTQLQLKQNMSQEALSALQRFSQCLMRTSHARATSVRGSRFEKEARKALESCLPSLPCWIMPTWRVSQFLPTELASFDLVVLDEASQSDTLALPVLLRAKRMLIVGDSKQVSPTEGFVSEDRIAELSALLPMSVSPFRGEMLPGRSAFDLAEVMFPKHKVVLTEHFRCAPQIIAYSNKEFYDRTLVPLRLPRASERLEPALLDNPVSGVKVGKTNVVEADAIVDEIWRLSNDKLFWGRSIGVISLMGSDQARMIRRKLLERLGDMRFKRHVIMCGDPPTFQGAEYDIIFLSMVASPGSCPTQTGLMYCQRFNVAMSRARDRVYLFRSISADGPSNDADLKISLIRHFSDAGAEPLNGAANTRGGVTSAPHRSLVRTGAVSQLRCRLKKDGFTVQTGGVACDSGPAMQLIVHGSSDRRIGICIDGRSSESLNTSEQWNTSWQQSVNRRKVMARVGWKFWCCWETSFLLQPQVCYQELLSMLATERIVAARKPDDASVARQRRQGAAAPRAAPSVAMEGDDGGAAAGKDLSPAAGRGQKRAADDDEADGEDGNAAQPAAKRVRTTASNEEDEEGAAMIITDHAAVLGIPEDSDQAVVRAAYRQRMSDTIGSPGEGSGAAGHTKQALTSAFQALASSPGGTSGSATASAENDDDGVLSESHSDADSDPNFSDPGDSADESEDETMYDAADDFEEGTQAAAAHTRRGRGRGRGRARRRQNDSASGLPPWRVGSVGSSRATDCPLPGVDV